MKRKYFKRHYTSDIKRSKIKIGLSCDTLFVFADSDNFNPSESIEISEEDLTRPLPEDKLTKIDRHTYHVDFWRYEVDEFSNEEEYEDGCFDTDVLSSYNAVVVWDENEGKFVLNTI